MSKSPEFSASEMLGPMLLDATTAYEALRDAAIATPGILDKNEYLGRLMIVDDEEESLDAYDLAEKEFDTATKAKYDAMVTKQGLNNLKRFRLGFIEAGDLSMTTLHNPDTHGSFLDNETYTFTAPHGELSIKRTKHTGRKRKEFEPTGSDYLLAAQAISVLEQVNTQLVTEA